MVKIFTPKIEVKDVSVSIQKEMAHGQIDHSTDFLFDPRKKKILQTAYENIDAGTKMLPMEAFPKPIRWLARLAGRIFLYLGSIITVPQRQFNNAIYQLLRLTIDQIHDEIKRFKNIEKELCNIEQRMNDQRVLFWEQHRRVDLLFKLIETKEPMPALGSYKVEIDDQTGKQPQLMDVMYLAFEDRFRGQRNMIMERQRIYLDYIYVPYANRNEFRIIDLGCGRGEWLELLKQNAFQAIGIDSNDIMVNQCLERELQAIKGDAIQYIKSCEDNSIDLITGFHIVEHLPFEVLISLFDETFRALRNGGMAIFETPNPENILVGSYNFYLDPTHRNPIPPNTLSFIAEFRGFSKVNVLRLHPDIPLLDSMREHQVPEDLIPFFTKEMDYSIIIYK